MGKPPWLLFTKLKFRFRTAVLALFLCSAIFIVYHSDVIPLPRLRKNDLGIYILDTEELRPHFTFLHRPWRAEKAIKLNNPCEKKRLVKYAMVFVVKSAIGNRLRRDAIRQTWGSVKFLDIVSFETIFVVGNTSDINTMNKVADESNKYGDILQFNAEDIPKNVPEKVLAGMQWAAWVLPPMWFYASIDDDIIINYAKLVNYFNRMIGLQFTNDNGKIDFPSIPISCIYSYQDKDKPSREKDSKWYMPEENFPGERWPIYCRGGMYTTSSDMVKKLYEVSRRTPRLYLDDVWVTGFMRLKVEDTDENIVAAPGSQLTEKELHQNVWLSPTMVYHFWGNIAGKKVDIPDSMKKMYRTISKVFSTRALCTIKITDDTLLPGQKLPNMNVPGRVSQKMPGVH